MLSFVYNPDNQSDAELRDRFVIRTKEFKRIMADISELTLAQTPQHYLIIGQRGTGKTSLLLRIKSEIHSTADLQHIIPVQFAEEQYGIFNLCRLWEKVAEELEETQGFTDLLTQLEQQAERSDYTQNCFELLENYLIKNQRRLLLLIDNFGDLLDKLSLTEQQRLRDIFHNSTYIQLIAASAKVLEHSYQHDSPFFEFFKTLVLSGLTKTETYALLRKLAEVYGLSTQMEDIISQQAYRVESIRRLTGGVPRTIVLLFEIFMDDSGDVFDDLETILDRVTPLYKHRMDDLPTQQQVIVNALALNWDGMTTKELTDKINNPDFSSKKISSQLQSLQKNGLVSAKAIDKKNNIYLLQERFFNIWYLMRFGRKQNKQNVLWLISFLKEWCSTEDLHARAHKHIQAAKAGKLNPKSYLMAESMGYLISDEYLQHELIHETRKALSREVTDIDRNLSASDREIMENAKDFYNKKNYLEAIKNFKFLANKDNSIAMNNLAILYHIELKDFQQAIHYYKLASDNGNSKAMNNLALLYDEELKDFQQAIHYYKLAIDNGNSAAMNNLAVLYDEELKDFQQAIHYAKLAIENGNSSAMFNLAVLYDEELKDFQQAIHYYKLAINNGDNDAMYNLANLYNNELKDFQQAIHYYKLASDNGNSKAMNTLAWLYYKENINFLESFSLAQQAYTQNKQPAIIHTLATVLLWNNQIPESIEKIKEFLQYPEFYLKWIEDVSDYFILLLARNQPEAAYQLIKETPDLEEQIKPVYYAILTLLKDKYPKEYLKMGSELKETVDEVLLKVKQKAERYNTPSEQESSQAKLD
jgi:TPR repeat protein/GTPase SAR1 family protein